MAKLEVHEHSFTSGPRRGQTIKHSHPGGDVQHSHSHTGPACYTIDRNAWLRATMLSGGGKKRFTARPNGEQLAVIAA